MKVFDLRLRPTVQKALFEVGRLCFYPVQNNSKTLNKIHSIFKVTQNRKSHCTR